MAALSCPPKCPESLIPLLLTTQAAVSSYSTAGACCTRCLLYQLCCTVLYCMNAYTVLHEITALHCNY